MHRVEEGDILRLILEVEEERRKEGGGKEGEGREGG